MIDAMGQGEPSSLGREWPGGHPEDGGWFEDPIRRQEFVVVTHCVTTWELNEFAKKPEASTRPRSVGLNGAVPWPATCTRPPPWVTLPACSLNGAVPWPATCTGFLGQAIRDARGPISREESAMGDTPYDARAAGKAGLRTVGMLCGGWPEDALRRAGCIAIFRDPADLLRRHDDSPLAG